MERELKRRLKKKYALTKTQSYTTSRRVLAKYASDASSDTGHVPLNSTRALSGHGAGPQAGGVGLTASSRRGSLGGSTRSLEGSSPILGPSGPRLWGSSPLWRRMTEPASAVGSAAAGLGAGAAAAGGVPTQTAAQVVQTGGRRLPNNPDPALLRAAEDVCCEVSSDASEQSNLRSRSVSLLALHSASAVSPSAELVFPRPGVSSRSAHSSLMLGASTNSSFASRPEHAPEEPRSWARRGAIDLGRLKFTNLLVLSGGKDHGDLKARRKAISRGARRIRPCALPSDASREERVRWLLKPGRAMWKATTTAERHAMDKVGFLFEGFKVEYWFYELVEMLRKLLMTGAIALLYDKPVTQLTLGLVVTTAALIHFVRVHPYTSHMVNRIQTISLLVQLITLFYGFILNHNALQERSGETHDGTRRAFDGVIVFLHILIFFLPPAAIFHEEGPAVWLLLREHCCCCCCSASSTAQRSPRNAPRCRSETMMASMSTASPLAAVQERSAGAEREAAPASELLADVVFFPLDSGFVNVAGGGADGGVHAEGAHAPTAHGSLKVLRSSRRGSGKAVASLESHVLVPEHCDAQAAARNALFTAKHDGEHAGDVRDRASLSRGGMSVLRDDPTLMMRMELQRPSEVLTSRRPTESATAQTACGAAPVRQALEASIMIGHA